MQKNGNPLIESVFKQGGVFGKKFSDIKSAQEPERIITPPKERIYYLPGDNKPHKRITPALNKDNSIMRSQFLIAYSYVMNKGMKLPSIQLHRRYMNIYDTRYRTLLGNDAASSYYPAWSRELLVLPPRGTAFEFGMDVVCKHGYLIKSSPQIQDYVQEFWVLPVQYVPREAFDIKDVALFIDPLNIEIKKGVTIIRPAFVKMITNPLASDSYSCHIDVETGIPLEFSEQEHLDFSKDDMQYWQNDVYEMPSILQKEKEPLIQPLQVMPEPSGSYRIRLWDPYKEGGVGFV